ncbi:glycerophosphodiester phosphodiesterase [Shimazuella alba]|uniref:Glycerophosphodiester phosphodiesterase n=1 Tax=Shimazuella alba TaxID=2690964 RepID=A0A6I4VTC6_9BACL|nr:glycerophosphodiester phosphodiesterase [Shimazuella alba]MXQ53748.1 glycerophosphodiester phosphodiesterase [Shimazuella alba]
MAVQVFAHRGYSGRAMENSMTAFKLAKEANVDGIELDVHLTKDGEVIVIHDETLERTTTGKGWIEQLTYPEITKYSIATIPKETVPTLSNVLEFFLDTSTVINIELKNQYVRYPALLEKVLQLVEFYRMEHQVILSSFYHPCILELKKLKPAWNLAFLIDCVLVEPWKYSTSLGISQLHLHYSAIDEELIDGCRKYGVLARTYTVNEEKEMNRLVSLGVDAIITNYPTKLRKVIDRKGME